MIEIFFEFALIFLTLGAFYLFGYQLGYNHGLKDGVKATLEACNAMKEVILDLAFGEAQSEDTYKKDQTN